MSTPPIKKPRLSPLPHPRADCPSYLFHPSVHDVSHKRNLEICTSCFCLVCDIPASICPAWAVHCMAYYTHPDWRSLRVNRVHKVPPHLLPPCVTADRKNAAFVENVQLSPNAATFRVRAPSFCEYIDLESETVAQLPEVVKGEPKEVQCVELRDEPARIAAEQPKQRTDEVATNSHPVAEKEVGKQQAAPFIKTAEQARTEMSSQIQRPVSTDQQVESHASQVADKSVVKQHHGADNEAMQQASSPVVNTGKQHETNARPQAQPDGSVKQERQVQHHDLLSSSKQLPDRNSAGAPVAAPPNRKVESQIVAQDTSGAPGNANKNVAPNGLPVQNKHHSYTEKSLASKRRGEDCAEQSESEEESDSTDQSDQSEPEEGDVESQVNTSDSQLVHDRFMRAWMFNGLYSRFANRSTCRQKLRDLRHFWSVDKMLPAPHIERKRLQPPPATTGKSLPKRILIGYIDMWRPYCSHMAARNIQFSIGRHAKDVASLSTASDVRVTGMKTAQVDVLAKEMGIDLDKTGVLPLEHEDINCFDKDLKGLREFIGKSSFAWEDGSEMPANIPSALQACIRKNQIELTWELSHHAGAENKDKAFAAHHGNFGKLDRESRIELFRQQLTWLTQCKARLKNAEKLDRSNCCLLRAWVYLTPEAFSSNMVAAANFVPTNSTQAHMQPLDGGSSLGGKLSHNHSWRPRNWEKTAPPSLPPKDVEKERKNWDDLELSTHENDREPLQAILAALRSHDDGFVVSASGTKNGQTYSSVLDATTADGTSTFQSLCRTHRSSMDSITLSRARELNDELCNLSSEDESDFADKASIRGILSSSTFTVSDGYPTTADQPPQISLSLRRYQRESLAWMLDQENKRSISDPFWVRIRGFSSEGEAVDVFYCPLTGSMSRFAPPPVVGGVLAEEMGLGKTIIAVSLITHTLDEARRTYMTRSDCRRDLVPSHSTLIVCPVSLLKQWEKELKSSVSIPIKVLCWYGPRTTRAEDLAKYDVVLTTYGILSNGSHHPLIHVHWYRVIIDESTYLKGGGSSCHRQYMDLIASRRWAVSGTPFGDDFNRKFLATMRFIGVAPFSNSSSFQSLGNVFAEPLNSPALRHSFTVPRFAYVMKNILMRHVKAQKLHGEPLVDLPPATGRCVSIELGADEKAEYEELEHEVKQKASRFLRSQKAFGAHFVELAGMTRPLRVKADGVEPESLRKPRSKKGASGADDEAEAPPPVRNASRRVGAKVKQLLIDLRSYRDEDASSKFVVFTEFNGVKEEIKRTIQGNGFGVLTLDGSMSAGRRGRIIKKFAEDPDVAVLVLSMAAGACGLTLTMANVVVLFEVGLKMAIELQAVNRIHRIGQTRPVDALTYVAKGTIDERIVDVRKRRGQPGVVGEEAEGNGEDLSTLEVYRTMFGYQAM